MTIEVRTICTSAVNVTSTLAFISRVKQGEQ